MRVVGIAGTAKNTGKTTTTAALIKQATQEGRRVGLTSIGYDGEEWDNVTSLPKPRLLMPVGSIVAVAERCLTASDAQIEVLARSGINTPLGEILMGRVEKEGLVVIAGPNKAYQLAAVLELFKAYCPDVVLVDGALNRLAPMVVTEGLILATGAARNHNPDRLFQETVQFCDIFRWPRSSLKEGVTNPAQGEEPGEALAISMFTKGVCTGKLPTGSLLEEGQVESVLRLVSQQPGSLVIPGIISLSVLKSLLAQFREKALQPELVFADPIKLLVSGDFFDIKAVLDQWRNQGGRVTFLNDLPLLMVTLNPFYPAYDEASRQYTPAYIDGAELRARLSAHLGVPITDVVQEETAVLFKSVLG